MSEMEFEKFGKIGRLNRDVTITEKVDGTNAQLLFDAFGRMMVGSRTREIWPEGTEGKEKGCDNAAFAKWAYENQQDLFEFLGEGRHYGEWAGAKIQRKYGMDHRVFALFNTHLFGEAGESEIPENLVDIGLTSVPVLYEGLFTTDTVDRVMRHLKETGSQFAPFFMNPEGIVIYHHGAKVYFKQTFEHDNTGKGKNRQTGEG